MYKIALKNLEFFGYHGLYLEENKVGNQFVVDITITMADELIDLEGIQNTVNYEDIYAIVKMEMNTPQKLLEILAKSILAKLETLSSQIKKIKVSIRKNHVPINGMIGQAEICISKNIYANV